MNRTQDEKSKDSQLARRRGGEGAKKRASEGMHNLGVKKQVTNEGRTSQPLI